MCPCRPAFTLLEIVVVLVIMAIMTTAVTISAAGWFQSAKIDDVADQVAFIDRIMRTQARRLKIDRQVIFDLDQQSIMRKGSDQQGLRSHRFTMPGGVKMKSIVTAGSHDQYGQVTIDYTQQGHTKTYAVLIATADDNESWIVIVGLTGQVMTFEKSEEVDRVFEQLSI